MLPADTYCDRCHLQFATPRQLHQHKVRNPPPGRHNYCPVGDCGHDFMTKDGLTRHTKQMHAHEQELSCPGCQEKFNRVGGLMGHLEFGNCPGMPNFRGLLYKDKEEEEKKPSAFDQIKAHGEALAQQKNMMITAGVPKSVATNQSTTMLAAVGNDLEMLKLDSADQFPPLGPQMTMPQKPDAKPPKPDATDFLGPLGPNALAAAPPRSTAISSNIEQLGGGLSHSRWATALPPIAPLKPQVKVPEELARAHSKFLDGFLTGVETEAGEGVGVGVGAAGGVGTSNRAGIEAENSTKKEEPQGKDDLLDFFLGDGWHHFIPTQPEATASQAAPAVQKSLKYLTPPATAIENQNSAPSPHIANIASLQQASTTQSNCTSTKHANFPQASSSGNRGTPPTAHIVPPTQANSVLSNTLKSVPPHLAFAASDAEFPTLGSQPKKTSAPQLGQYASVASRAIPIVVPPGRIQIPQAGPATPSAPNRSATLSTTQNTSQACIPASPVQIHTNGNTTASSVSKAPQAWSTAYPTQTNTSVNAAASRIQSQPQAWVTNKNTLPGAVSAKTTPALTFTPPVDATPIGSPALAPRITNPNQAVTIDGGESHASYDPDGPNFKANMFYNEFTKKYKCPHKGCKKSHDSINAFKQHLKSLVHTEESRKLQCPKCLRYYPNSTALTQHAESQSFRCDIREQGNYTAYIEDFTAKVATVAGRWQDDGTIRYDTLAMGKNKGELKPEQKEEVTAAEAVRKTNEEFLSRQAKARANFWNNNDVRW